MFEKLNLPKDMIKNLSTLGYERMTEVQKESIPAILEKKDVMAQAKTGSGKTAAFGIGLIMSLDLKDFRVGGLVLCPTRELADQVAKELRRIARHIHNTKIITICGGTPIGPQYRSLEHGAHIVVGTPGRIMDHLEKGTLNLRKIRTLVLDEADKMLDMGFAEKIADIVKRTPKTRQTLLFSATYPETMEEISRDFLNDPVSIKVESTHKNRKIKQVFIDTKKMNRVDALINVFYHYNITSSVIFCRTKQQCDEVADELDEKGFFAEAIHGDLEQRDRDEVLTLFSNGSISFLVATDVAARGLDIKSLQSVINYEVSNDPKVHIHRIGRTGRMDQEGLAISLYSDRSSYKVEAIEAYLKKPLEKRSADSLKDTPISIQPPKATICIDMGKKNKLRPGDILGSLTNNSNIKAAVVGNINIYPYHSYVAIDRGMVKKALNHLVSNTLKGRRNVKARIVD